LYRYNPGFMRQLRDFEQELVQARRQGRLLGRLQINAAVAERAEAELKEEAEEEAVMEES
jgi:hypothetical protein